MRKNRNKKLNKFDNYFSAKFSGTNFDSFSLMHPEGMGMKSGNTSINIRPYTVFYFISINKNISPTAPIAYIVKVAASSVSEQ